MRPTLLLLVLGSFLGGCGLLWGCSRAEKTHAYAERIQNAHALADRARAPQEQEVALQAIEQAFEASPRGPKAAATALRQDLADRAARLHLAAGHPQKALAWVQMGKDLDDSASVLRANLLITEADCLLSLGQKERARRVLLAALEINSALLNVELENP